MAVTVSIGIGLDGLTYAQNYEFARNAIDLALGRGGDQAVVKTPKNIVYYGGKSQQVEKNTRVKARVKAQALREIISGKENVLIMGHRIPDVDSFGAAVGIYRVASTLGRQTHIVLNEVSTSMKPMVDHFRHHQDYAEGQIVSKTLTQNQAVSITLFSFAKGEEISTHESGGDAFVTCLDGIGKITIDGVEYLLHEGESIVMPAGHPHAVYGQEAFKMLLVVVF